MPWRYCERDISDWEFQSAFEFKNESMLKIKTGETTSGSGEIKNAELELADGGKEASEGSNAN